MKKYDGTNRKYCVQFTKLRGDQITFVKQFNEYRTEESCLYFVDNCPVADVLFDSDSVEPSISQGKEAPLKMLEDELEREGVDYL